MSQKQIFRRLRRAILAAGVAAACITTGAVPALAAGWVQNSDQSWSYQKEDGSWLLDGYTSDGFYLNPQGYWYETSQVLGLTVPVRTSFAGANSLKLSDWKNPLNEYLGALTAQTGQNRGISLSDDSLNYYYTDGTGKSTRLLLSRVSEYNGYRLEVACSLARDQGQTVTMAWYDYQTLRYLLLRISRCGNQLADAVYSSWEKGNAYGLKFGQWVQIGDSEIRYSAGTGTGIYEIRPIG